MKDLNRNHLLDKVQDCLDDDATGLIPLSDGRQQWEPATAQESSRIIALLGDECVTEQAAL